MAAQTLADLPSVAMASAPPSKSAMTAIASTTMSAPTAASEPVAVMRSSSRVRTATTAMAMMMTPVEATAGSLAAVTASPAGT